MKRRIIALLCALVLVTASLPQIPAKAGQTAVGKAISSREELLQFASAYTDGESQDAYLTEDIDLGGEIFDGSVFKGTYSGTFDGNGKAITGLVISNEENAAAGLFENLAGTVKNLTVTTGEAGITSATESNVGILAGIISGRAVVENVTVNGSISISADSGINAAGFAGCVSGEEVSFIASVNNADISNGFYSNLAELKVNTFGSDAGFEAAFDGDESTAYIPEVEYAKTAANWQDDDGVWQLPIYSEFPTAEYTAVELAVKAMVTGIEIVPVKGMEESLAGARFDASVDGMNWITLAAVKDAPVFGESFTAPVKLYGRYNYFRVINNGDENFPLAGCNIAEIRFSGIISDEKREASNEYCLNSKIVALTGGESWNNGSNSFDKAWDGNFGTYYDPATADAELSFTQAEFAEPAVITKIAFFPRLNWANRMIGGIFEASADGENWTQLYRVTSAPDETDLNYVKISDTALYRFLRYRNGSNELNSSARCDIAEIRAYSDSSLTAESALTGEMTVSRSLGDPNEAMFEEEEEPLEPEPEEVELITSEKINEAENVAEIFGSAQWNPSLDYGYEKVWDGDTSTFFASHNNAYTGIRLIAPAIVKRVEIFPRENYQNKMMDAELQGSNDGENWETIHKVGNYVLNGKWYVGNLDNETAYIWYRLVNNASPNCQLDLAEVSLFSTVKYETVEIPANGTVLMNSFIARISGDYSWRNNNYAANCPWSNISGDTAVFYDGNKGGSTIAEFDSPVLVNKISLAPRADQLGRFAGCSIYGSDDKQNWTLLCEVTGAVAAGEWAVFELEDAVPYQYYKCVNDKTNNNVSAVLLYRVEEQTEDETPERLTCSEFVEEYFSSAAYASGYTAECAFDMDPATFFCSKAPEDGIGSYVGVELKEEAVVKRVELVPRDGWQNRFAGARLCGSNDGVEYTPILTVNSYVQDGKFLVINLPANETAYRWYRYDNPTGFNKLSDIAEIQLYSTVKEDIIESVPAEGDVLLNDYILRVEGSRCWHELDRSNNRYTAQTIWNVSEDPSATGLYFDGNGKGDAHFSTAVFEEPVTVNRISLFPRSDATGLSRFAGIRVAGSDDGISWTDIITIENAADEAKWYVRRLAEDVTYKYFRVTNDVNTVNLAGIRLEYIAPVDEDRVGLITRDHYVEVSGTADWRNRGIAGPEKAWDDDFGTYFDPNAGEIFIPGEAEDPETVAWTQVELDGLYKISKIAVLPREGWSNRIVGGKFYGSVDGTAWEEILTINLQAPEDEMTHILVASPAEYKFVRYTNGGKHTFVRTYDGETTEIVKSVRCDIAEIRLYTGEFTETSNKVDYPEDSLNDRIVHIYGDMPNYPFNEVTCAFDGDVSTFYGSESDSTGYLIAEFDEPAVVRSISVYPRPGQPKYMLGGKFYGSVDGKRWTTLYTISEKPANRNWTRFDLKNEREFKYYKYANSNAYADVAEIIFRSERENPVPESEDDFKAPASFETKTAAGFAGYIAGGNVSFTGCVNSGTVMGTYAAGFVAVNAGEGSISVNGCVNSGDVTGLRGGYAFARKCMQEGCESVGDVLDGGAADRERWFLPIPAPDGGKLPLSFYVCGPALYEDWYGYSIDESYEEVVDAAEEETFESYLDKLADNGFTVVYTNQIDANSYAQVKRGDILVDVNYLENKGTMHVIYNRGGIPIDEFCYEYEKQDGDTTEFYMYSYNTQEQGADPSSNWIDGLGTDMMNGELCLVIKTADNRVIIYDGGMETNEYEEAYFNDFLHRITGRAADEKVDVAAWTITHPHGDHWGFVESFLDDYHDSVNVERLMYTVVSVQEHPDSYAYSHFADVLRKYYPEIKVLRMETCQEIRLGDVKFEVLFTPDDAISKAIGSLDVGGNLNDSSVITKVTFDGRSFMVLGDTNNKNYNPNFVFSKETMKSDVVQAAHHAYNKVDELYDVICAEYVLVPDARYNFEFNTGENKNYGTYYPAQHLWEITDHSKIFCPDDGINGFRVENGELVHLLLPLYDRTYAFSAQFENTGVDFGDTEPKDIVIGDYALETVDFGAVEEGETAPAVTVNLRNTGYRSLVITDVSVNSSAFTASCGNMGVKLLGYDYGVGQTVPITVTPAEGLKGGVYTATLTVEVCGGLEALSGQKKTFSIPVELTVAGTEPEKFEIVSQPSDVLVGKKHDMFSFSVEATGENVTYMWYYMLPGETKFHKSGNTTASYTRTASASTDGIRVYCKVSCNGETIISDIAVGMIAGGKIMFEVQPASVTAAKHETVTFTASATAAAPVNGSIIRSEDSIAGYMWYYRRPGEEKFHKSGCTAKSYTRTASASTDGLEVYCLITDIYGNTMKSEVAKLTLAK